MMNSLEVLITIFCLINDTNRERSNNAIHTNKVGLVIGHIQLCKLYIGFRFLFKAFLLEIDIYY
ncbi:hypothetical protein WN51_11389 [Melipona quadrifasciata]|uniref:Uncharacterized protein n=1 Tax=Melipona quadrifasciata TaxID=166423 RepID=A0A0M9ABJ3_9HYME|nr:hypothetical protein WN51_11389 [Melipona quadrifasciata]